MSEHTAHRSEPASERESERESESDLQLVQLLWTRHCTKAFGLWRVFNAPSDRLTTSVNFYKEYSNTYGTLHMRSQHGVPTGLTCRGLPTCQGAGVLSRKRGGMLKGGQDLCLSLRQGSFSAGNGLSAFTLPDVMEAS